MATQPDVATRIKAALEFDTRINLHRWPIRVTLNGAEVRLDGEVEHVGIKRLALRLATEIAGARVVVDGVRVVPSRSAGDGEIADAFTTAVLAQRELKSCTLRRRDKGTVKTLQQPELTEPSGDVEFRTGDDGVISLEGRVISLSHRRILEALAWWTPGVRQVEDRLEVVPPEDDNDDELADAVRLVLEMDPIVNADQIGIRTAAGVVTLTGLLHRREGRHMAELDAWAVAGVRDVVNRIVVEP